jgi:hypothetical protein
LYVANHGKGTISLYDEAKDWKLSRTVDVDHKGIVHISAPAGKAFSSVLLATCHGDGRQASYQDTSVYLVDMRRGMSRRIRKDSLASSSHDGKPIVVDDAFVLTAVLDLTIDSAERPIALEVLERVTGERATAVPASDRVRVPARDGTRTLLIAVRALDAAGVAATDVALHEPTLDDVFLALTGHAAEGAEPDPAGPDPVPAADLKNEEPVS